MKAKLHKTHHGVDGEPFAIVELHDRVPVEERAGSELRIEEVFRALSLKPARSDDWNLAVRRFLNRLGPPAFGIERKRAGITQWNRAA